jgi:YidC/Oxa1 family membrane protein insertase
MKRMKKYLFISFIFLGLFILSSCTRHFCSDEDRLKIIDGLTQQTFIQEQAEAKTIELMEKEGISNPTKEHELFNKYYLGTSESAADIKARAALDIKEISEDHPDFESMYAVEFEKQLNKIKSDALVGNKEAKKEAQELMGVLYTTASEYYFSQNYPKACIVTEDTVDPVSGGLIEGKTWFESMKFGPIEFLFVYPIAWLIISIAKLFGNTAIAAVVGLVITTIIVRLLTFGLTFKSTIQSQKLTLVQPEIQELQQKYGNSNDPNTKNIYAAEMMKVYKKHGIKNPLAPLLSPFVTLPIFIAMWGAVNGVSLLRTGNILGLELGSQLFSNLGINNLDNFNLFAWIILLFLIASQVVSMKLPAWYSKKKRQNNPKFNSKVDEQKYKAMQSSTTMMTNMMLIMIIGMGLFLPTAMSIYWIFTALMTIVQQVVIQKWVLGKEQ